MPDIVAHLSSCINTVLQCSVLDIPLRQRAKFEGWLKIELAKQLEATADYRVRLEESYGTTAGRTHRADISLRHSNGPPVFLMLKTTNTNFRFDDVVQGHRPITKNIAGIVDDISKLQACSDSAADRYVVAPIFPVSSQSEVRTAQLKLHLDKVWQGASTMVGDGFVHKHAQWGIYWIIGHVEG